MRPDAHTLLAAYAADALDPADRSEVEAHLEECDTCREDLRGFRETLGMLAATTGEAPPARLRANVLARIRTTPQLPPLVDAVGAAPGPGRAHVPARQRRDAGAAPAASTGPGESPEQPGDVPRRQRATVSRSVFALAASVLTLLALGGGAYAVNASSQLADVRAQQAAVQQVLAADDVTPVSGRPDLGAGVLGDDVVVLASRDADAALLLPAGLPQAPDGSTWQAWTITGGEPVSAGVFDVSGGEAVALDGGVVGVDAVAITLEPAGGSAAPTSDPVLVVDLA